MHENAVEDLEDVKTAWCSLVEEIDTKHKEPLMWYTERSTYIKVTKVVQECIPSTILTKLTDH